MPGISVPFWKVILTDSRSLEWRLTEQINVTLSTSCVSRTGKGSDVNVTVRSPVPYKQSNHNNMINIRLVLIALHVCWGQLLQKVWGKKEDYLNIKSSLNGSISLKTKCSMNKKKIHPDILTFGKPNITNKLLTKNDASNIC